MKKLLFASTALVLVAGAAAAEVKVSGDGRMGIVYNGDDWNFSSRIRAKFTMSGETDGGLTFGGSFRVDQEDENGGSASLGGAASIFVSGAFGKLSMGDVVGAAEAVLFDLPEVGFTDIGYNDVFFLTGDGHGAEDFGGVSLAGLQSAVTANNNPVLLYTYTTGSLTIAASLSDGLVAQTSTSMAQEYALGVNYAFGDYTVGLGYEVFDNTGATPDVSHIIVGGTATFGDTTVSAYYGQLDIDSFSGTPTHYGVGVSSVFGAFTVNAFAQNEDSDIVGVDSITSYGIGGIYDLGGGASIVGGVATDDTPGAKTKADIGMKFTF